MVDCIEKDLMRSGIDMGLKVESIVEMIGKYWEIRIGFGKLIGKKKWKEKIIVRVEIGGGGKIDKIWKEKEKELIFLMDMSLRNKDRSEVEKWIGENSEENEGIERG